MIVSVDLCLCASRIGADVISWTFVVLWLWRCVHSSGAAAAAFAESASCTIAAECVLASSATHACQHEGKQTSALRKKKKQPKQAGALCVNTICVLLCRRVRVMMISGGCVYSAAKPHAFACLVLKLFEFCVRQSSTYTLRSRFVR